MNSCSERQFAGVASYLSSPSIVRGVQFMSLSIGQKVYAETSKAELVVKRKLGEGGQGAVFLVDGPHGAQALKWYVASQATEEQRAAISFLVVKGPPRGPAGRRFIWPQDLVVAAGTNLFGYLMPLIDTNRFADLGEVWARRKPSPSLGVLCGLSFQISNSYRVLHLDGYCYRDISQGNLMFDPITGDALICDNDNVGINGESRLPGVSAIPYMAPELVRGDCRPPFHGDGPTLTCSVAIPAMGLAPPFPRNNGI